MVDEGWDEAEGVVLRCEFGVGHDWDLGEGQLERVQQESDGTSEGGEGRAYERELGWSGGGHGAWSGGCGASRRWRSR